MADERFDKIYASGSTISQLTEIIVDKETGVHYLLYLRGQAGGITPLLDENGEVVIKKDYK